MNKLPYNDRCIRMNLPEVGVVDLVFSDEMAAKLERIKREESPEFLHRAIVAMLADAIEQAKKLWN